MATRCTVTDYEGVLGSLPSTLISVSDVQNGISLGRSSALTLESPSQYRGIEFAGVMYAPCTRARVHIDP
jgi:hypothetical protein